MKCRCNDPLRWANGDTEAVAVSKSTDEGSESAIHPIDSSTDVHLEFDKPPNPSMRGFRHLKSPKFLGIRMICSYCGRLNECTGLPNRTAEGNNENPNSPAAIAVRSTMTGPKSLCCVRSDDIVQCYYLSEIILTLPRRTPHYECLASSAESELGKPS